MVRVVKLTKDAEEKRQEWNLAEVASKDLVVLGKMIWQEL